LTILAGQDLLSIRRACGCAGSSYTSSASATAIIIDASPAFYGDAVCYVHQKKEKEDGLGRAHL